MAYRGVIEQYRKHLPVSEKTPVVTLLEGNTPLIPAPNLEKKIGFPGKIFLKYEGMNPTGSFKDRGMTLAVSKAVESGSSAVICASTGNTSASAAAYAARAGLKCVVLIPAGKIALGKLSQAVMHGALVLAVDGNFDVALKLVKALSEKHPLTLVNSLNPYRIEGQKSGAFEICDALGRAPDYQFMPVGNAGNITAYWKGYTEYNDQFSGACGLPKMMGFQAAGSAPIVCGHPVEKPET
ncbi:MAG: threonine synthase, partial [Endomicrobiales bacterium]